MIKLSRVCIFATLSHARTHASRKDKQTYPLITREKIFPVVHGIIIWLITIIDFNIPLRWKKGEKWQQEKIKQTQPKWNKQTRIHEKNGGGSKINMIYFAGSMPPKRKYGKKEEEK